MIIFVFIASANEDRVSPRFHHLLILVSDVDQDN